MKYDSVMHEITKAKVKKKKKKVVILLFREQTIEPAKLSGRREYN